MLARIANREYPDLTLLQKQSYLGLCCLSMPVWQATSVQNFRTFTITWYFYDIAQMYIVSSLFSVFHLLLMFPVVFFFASVAWHIAFA